MTKSTSEPDSRRPLINIPPTPQGSRFPVDGRFYELSKLKNYEDRYVRWAVVDNPNTDMATLEYMLNDTDEMVREAAKDNIRQRIEEDN
jgi:mRNA degradation ribonuclease J1/J2